MMLRTTSTKQKQLWECTTSKHQSSTVPKWQWFVVWPRGKLYPTYMKLFGAYQWLHESNKWQNLAGVICKRIKRLQILSSNERKILPHKRIGQQLAPFHWTISSPRVGCATKVIRLTCEFNHGGGPWRHLSSYKSWFTAEASFLLQSGQCKHPAGRCSN